MIRKRIGRWEFTLYIAFLFGIWYSPKINSVAVFLGPLEICYDLDK